MNPIKTCSCCGASYARETWCQLPDPKPWNLDGLLCEQRQCTCESHLVVVANPELSLMAACARIQLTQNLGQFDALAMACAELTDDFADQYEELIVAHDAIVIRWVNEAAERRTQWAGEIAGAA